MKRLLSICLGVLLSVSCVSLLKKFTVGGENITVCAEEGKTLELQGNTEDLHLRAKSAYMMDAQSMTCIYQNNPTKPLPIASMCKIMTLILSFDEIEKGNLSFDEQIKVSERASKMGGSQVFLEAGGEYRVVELIKSIIVCSANDSCVAMAERICGSEEVFCDRMNERAKELGAENTLFSNCTGLPKDPQYSCAKDVALFLRELTRHEEYFRLASIWSDRFYHPQGRYTEITNTNRLIRFYDGCDGGKTGFTNQAGFCLAATAKRGEMRIISVVIGEETSDHRFADVRTMFDYAFANYTLKTAVDGNNVLPQKVKVVGGKKEYITVRPQKSLFVFARRGEKEDYSVEIKLKKSVKAPVKAGRRVGEIILYKNQIEVDRVPIVANESAKRGNIFDYLKSIGDAWNS